MGQYVLPDLPYDYSALEPHISAQIMQLHHDKHHAAYVKGANTALEQLAEARTKNDFGKIALLQRALAFHVSGHVMHSLFWQNMKPKAGGQPSGDLGAAVTRDFGNFDAFRAQLNQAAATIMGSGWGALCWDPVGKRLFTTQIYDHQSNTAMGSVPLMVIDAWEHAWYLQYQTDKVKFFESLWNLWNWDDISARFRSASTLALGLDRAASA